jgi:phosphoenolpyruvate synthase/pyruvate phosphate dikinase
MELVRNFTQLNKGDAHLAGGKGASLGEMTQAGIPVPPGFVVLSESFEQFLRETDLVQEIDTILHKINHKEIHTVERASEDIRALILSRDMPQDIREEINRSFKELDTKYVAVRSSATAEDGMDHAWAGQLESYLNTTEEDLLTKVKLCWSSLFTPRAIFYRFEKGLHTTKISVAVVVQKMIESEVSGIAFSVHPVTEDHNQLIIEAGFGLGEAIVSGSITPDSYVVEKEPRKILDINISTQERGLYRTENASVEHGNNEWVTIPEPKASSQVLNEAQILELSEIILHIEKHYGFPCDIEWAYEAGKFYIVQSRPITTLSSSKSVAIDSDDLVDAFLNHMSGKQIEKQECNASIAVMGNVCDVVQPKYFNKYYSTPFDDFLLLQKDRGGIVFFSLEKYRKCSWDTFEKIFNLKSTFELSEYKDYCVVRDKVFELYKENNIPEDLSELTSYLEELFDLECKLLASTLFSEAMDHEIAYKMAEHLNIDNTENFLEYATLPAFESFIIWQDELLIQGKGERWMLSDYYGVPTTSEADKMLKDKLEAMDIPSVKQEIENQKKSTSENKNKIQEYRNSLDEDAAKLLEYIQISMELRDRRKEAIQKIVVLVVDAFTVLAKKFNLTYHDISFAHKSELPQLENDDFLKEIKVRKEKGAILLATPEGSRISAYEFDTAREKVVKTISYSATEIKGVVAQRGKASGTVKVILSEKDFPKFESGDILVTSMTRPEFVPLMKKASAVITDEGGITCHAAIISRELKLPCIIGTRTASLALKDGDMVEVDADSGVIKIISSSSSFDPTKIEWHKLMEQRNLFFVGLAFTDIESTEFNKIIGFELKHFLFKFEKGNWSTYKSNKEFEELYKHISNLIKTGNQRFIDLAKKGVEYNKEGARYIREHSLKPTEITLENFDKEYDLYCNILLYGVTIPWDVIGTIETMNKDEQSEYKSILDAFEPLRAESLYPDFEKGVLQKYRDEISRKHNIDLALLNLLTPQELRKSIESDSIPEESTLKKRFEYCVYWFNPTSNQIDFTFNDSIEQKIPVLQRLKVESTDTIKGTIAYKGVVKGRVRIVYEPQDCSLFEKGEILVSPSTNPSLMAAIQKCAGIVTDEGGMTSHAAIIARELKKPAIIGTKVATQLLNNGDMVEVDAEKGIVTIIK